MDWSDFAARLRRGSAYGAGQGAQYDRNLQLAEEEKHDSERERMAQQKQQALQMTQQIRSMADKYGREGAMQALMSLQEQADPALRPALQEYATLLSESGNDMTLLMRELDNDYFALGGEMEKATALQKGGTVVSKNKDGQYAINIPILDPATGKVTLSSTPIEGTMVNSAGADLEDQVQLAGQRTAASEGAKTTEKRYTDIVERGVEAARAMPTVKRAMEILGDVQTGGIDTAALKAKQFFGIESADEASLSSLLGKAVLSQLRDTFGAQFTEAEGARLERIEANIGKSEAGNTRILADLMKMNQTKIAQAVKAAEMRGDSLVLDEIRAYAETDLSPRDPPKPPAVNFIGWKQ